MKWYTYAALSGLLGLGACLLFVEPSHAEEGVPDGLEIQARGFVHEAFAQPFEVALTEEPLIVQQPPPEPLEEKPAEQKPEGADVQWIPGYFQWDEDKQDFIWVSGIWRDVPPNRQWVPGSWRKVEGGSQWVPGFWAPAQERDITYLPPPPAPQETEPTTPAPGDDYQFVPGCWYYKETQYVWRTGYWLQHKPGWCWQPSRNCWTPAGYVFCPGYWDYPLPQRGVLFAPVYVNRTLLARRDWSWTPSFAVSANFLPNALFINSARRHYCFGDYFTTAYLKGGYRPWHDYRVGKVGYDPLYAYHRNSTNRASDRELGSLYTRRYAGLVDAPPRTLAQQNTVVRGLSANRTPANLERLQNATVVQPLAQAPRQGGARLNTVSTGERERQQRSAEQFQARARERGRAESDLIARQVAPTKSNAPARTVQMPAREPRPEPRVETPRRDPTPRVETPRRDPPAQPPVKREQPPPRPEPRNAEPPKKVEQPRPMEQPRRTDPPQQPKRVDPPPQPRRTETPPSPPPQAKPTPPPQQPRPTPPPVQAQPQPRPSTPPPQPRATTPPPQPRPSTPPPAPRRTETPPPQPKVAPPPQQPRPTPPPAQAQPQPRPSTPPPQPRATTPPPQPRPSTPPPAPRRTETPPPQPRVSPPPPQPKPTAPPPQPRPTAPPPQPRVATPPPQAKPAAPPPQPRVSQPAPQPRATPQPRSSPPPQQQRGAPPPTGGRPRR